MKLSIVKDENEKIAWKNNVIEIKPYLSIEDMTLIVSSCVEAYEDAENRRFTSTKTDSLGFEITKLIGVLRTATDIDMENLDVSEVFASDLPAIVYEKIKNYNQLEEVLEMSLKDKREEIFGMGNTLSKILESLQNLPSFSAEELKKFAELQK